MALGGILPHGLAVVVCRVVEAVIAVGNLYPFLNAPATVGGNDVVGIRCRGNPRVVRESELRALWVSK